MPDDHDERPLVVAVTGGIGAGKSSFCRVLSELGSVARLDADAIVHDLLSSDGPCQAAVADHFGPRVLRSDGAIDRESLAAIVFADASARRELEEILHPEVRRILAQRVADLKREKRVDIVLVEIPLLAEKGAPPWIDRVVTVEADERIRRARLAEKGLSPSEISRRMAAQASQAERERVADHVVRNDADLAALAKEALRLLQEWRVRP